MTHGAGTTQYQGYGEKILIGSYLNGHFYCFCVDMRTFCRTMFTLFSDRQYLTSYCVMYCSMYAIKNYNTLYLICFFNTEQCNIQ